MFLFYTYIIVAVVIYLGVTLQSFLLSEQLKEEAPELFAEIGSPFSSYEVMFAVGPSPFFWFFFWRRYEYQITFPRHLLEKARLMFASYIGQLSFHVTAIIVTLIAAH